MITDILVRYLHFVSLILLLAAVLGQHLLLRKQMTRGEIARVQRLDILYAVTVIIVLLTGFAQWLWIGKPAQFYSSNPVFHVKITLFLLVGIISIYPSVFLGKQKKGEPEESIAVPGGLIWCVRIELLLLFAMPLLATLIARGIGIPVVSE
jgi:putative membrane protein